MPPVKSVPNLGQFWVEHAAWSRETFGQDHVRGPVGAMKHLAKEVQEVLAELADWPCGTRDAKKEKDAKLIEEFADCVFLVFDACRRAGFDYQQLVRACFDKLEKNKVREWQKPTAGDEPVEHVRE
jgi:NTP pyrophosphatase (non-canonical NTP hydrolase)